MTVADKIKSIFGMEGTEKPDKEPINTPQQQKLFEVVHNDYQTFKENRQIIEDQWRLEQRFYRGDHWYGLRPDHITNLRPSNVDNIAWAQTEAILGKITGWDPYPDFEAQEESDESKAQDLNDFMPYELRQIGFRSKYIRAVRTAVVHGPLALKTIFDPTVEGGRGQYKYDGQNDIIPVDLGSFFPDPRVKDFINLQKMGAIIINTRQTMEHFKERWPEQGKKVTADQDANEVEIFNLNSGSQDSFNYTDAYLGNESTQQQTAGLIEYWYRGLPKVITPEDKKLFEDLALSQVEQGKDPSESIAKADGTMEGIHCIYVSTGGVFLEHKAYVYDHGKYPFSARTLFPIEGNIWGKGFMRDMIKPQMMLNKFAELAVEGMAKQGNSAMMYEEGAINRNQVRTWKEQRSTPGGMLPVADGAISGSKLKEITGVDVPTTVFNMLNYYKEMLQKIPGQFDSANGQASSNVTSGEQAKALISAASTRLNIVTDAIQEALEEVFSQYIELIAQFYTTERVARVTGRKVGMSRERLVNGVPTQITNKLETGEQETLNLTEEYVPCFDIKVNIAADKPVDREYWIQMAFNMIGMVDPITQLPMIDAEAVRYTVQHGRMEPMSVIEARIQEAAGVQQQQQQMQDQFAQLQAENQTLQEKLGQASEQQNQQQQEDKMFDRNMQQQKMDIEAAKAAGMLQKQQAS
ncbi:hypothetical protein A3842_11180 [Paenibacillus sp. P3E]|uniref:portal protein n=1 Tax=Paenibacillus sp. P3E TaxID=1349435 RepID=UPI00093AAAED|nr:hypothetical protein [Paenibacillus sp. P3E]OKP81633.1 hypothetical protein A3842_11180 [Paenibacillus sp. P3E]